MKRTPARAAHVLLAISCLCLCFIGSLAGQEPAGEGKRVERKAADGQPAAERSRSEVVTIKGQANLNAHSYKMEKGNTYRITLKAEGFMPQVRVESQTSGILANPGGATFPGVGGTPLQGLGGAGVAQMIFTAGQTKEHQIKVEHLAGTELGAGPLAYTLTIEKASPQRLLEVKDALLEVAENTKKMEAGKAYNITVTGKGFAPEVQVLDGTRAAATGFHGRWFGFGPDAEFVATLTFVPSRTTDYRVVVGVGPVADKRKAPPTYATEIVELKLDLNVHGQITKGDPVYPRRGGPHKVHTVKLEAGKNYQIDLISRIFDPYLFLEDAAGNLLMEDDDGGENLNARLIYRPSKSGVYRIIATTFDRGPGSAALGAYNLMVLQNPQAMPRFGKFSTGGTGHGDLPK